jgi:hypothetical protein
VTDAVQVSNAQDTSSVTTYTHCAGLQYQADGELVLQSCEGFDLAGDEVFFPGARDQTGHICGLIQNLNGAVTSGTRERSGQVSVAALEGCLLEEYTSCGERATLTYQTYLPSGVTTHVLVVTIQAGEQTPGSCWLMDYVAAPGNVNGSSTCSGLVQLPGGGIVVKGCGTEGDVTIPAPPHQ